MQYIARPVAFVLRFEVVENEGNQTRKNWNWGHSASWKQENITVLVHLLFLYVNFYFSFDLIFFLLHKLKAFAKPGRWLG